MGGRGSCVVGIVLLIACSDSGDATGRDGGIDRSDAGTIDPLESPIPNCHPSTPVSTGDVREDCVARINQFRSECQHLPPLLRWTEAESCADEQAAYDSARTPHAGFQAELCSPSGLAQNECPGWSSTDVVISSCLDQMWAEGPGEPFSEHGHYINMSSRAYARVACGFHTTPAGQVWAVQNFSP